MEVEGGVTGPGTPRLSLVIPVLDGGEAFARVLEAIARSTFRDFELIVADDGSLDGSVRAARDAGATVVSTAARRSGPAAARNCGAAVARGEILCFVDADCEPHRDTLARVASAFESDPELAALFGSYDQFPPAPGLIAQYKNLLHHFTHQSANANASTFWGGCGAVRRNVFMELSGFDAASYPRPSIEDIDFGYRLRDAGGTIRLDPSIQVTHHKAWTFRSLLISDIRDRALPWSRLMLRRGRVLNDLNVDTTGRASAVAAAILLGSLCAVPFVPLAIAAAIPAAAAILFLNRRFYGFLLRARGRWFLMRVLPLHWLYFLYSATCFAMMAAWMSVAPQPADVGPGGRK